MKSVKLPQPEVNVKGFRLSKLKEKEYRHFGWLLIWPIYYLRYFIVEAVNTSSTACYVMYSPLDDWIPLCEFFLIPYGLWMVSMLAMHFFTMLYDVDTFKRYSRFILISFTISTTIFLLFPTCQNLRPETFRRSNLFTWILGILYKLDTNTNVCPSEHVIGAVAVLAAAWNCRYFRTPWRMLGMFVFTVLVCLSTVFLKQHSILDLLAALPICLIVYVICFWRKNVKETKADSVLNSRESGNLP